MKKAGPTSALTTIVNRKDTEPIIIANIDLWVAAYRVASGRPVPEPATMSNAQLIYKTTHPQVVLWMKTLTETSAKVTTEWRDVIDKLNAAYPVPDGSSRLLSVQENLIVGYVPLDGEAPPTGWVHREDWGAFVPTRAC